MGLKKYCLKIFIRIVHLAIIVEFLFPTAPLPNNFTALHHDKFGCIRHNCAKISLNRRLLRRKARV